MRVGRVSAVLACVFACIVLFIVDCKHGHGSAMLGNCLMTGLTMTDIVFRLFYAASAEGFNVYVLVRFRGHFVSPVGLSTSSCFHGWWLYDGLVAEALSQCGASSRARVLGA